MDNVETTEPKLTIPELIEHYKNRKFQTRNGASLLAALELIQAQNENQESKVSESKSQESKV